MLVSGRVYLTSCIETDEDTFSHNSFFSWKSYPYTELTLLQYDWNPPNMDMPAQYNTIYDL